MIHETREEPEASMGMRSLFSSVRSNSRKPRARILSLGGTSRVVYKLVGSLSLSWTIDLDATDPLRTRPDYRDQWLPHRVQRGLCMFTSPWDSAASQNEKQNPFSSSVAFLYSYKSAWQKSGFPSSLAIRLLPPSVPCRRLPFTFASLRETRGNGRRVKKDEGQQKGNKAGANGREASYDDEDENDDDAHSIWFHDVKSKRGRERETSHVEIEDRGRAEEIGAFTSFAVSRREMDSGMSAGTGRWKFVWQ